MVIPSAHVLPTAAIGLVGFVGRMAEWDFGVGRWRLEKESPELRSTMRLARCHFSLGPFVRCGLLASGRDNVTVRLQPRVDTGSLTSSGCIEDGAGALHRSIGHWIRAAHGLNFYRMPVAQRRTLSVQYHGRDLAPILFPLPPSDEPPTSRLDPVTLAVKAVILDGHILGHVILAFLGQVRLG